MKVTSEITFVCEAMIGFTPDDGYFVVDGDCAKRRWQETVDRTASGQLESAYFRRNCGLEDGVISSCPFRGMLMRKRET